MRAQEIPDNKETRSGDSADSATSAPPAAAPAPEPADVSPRLLPRGSEQGLNRDELEDDLNGADEVMALVRDRTLSEDQRRQAEAAEGFLAQAREALQKEDLERCSFLVEKSAVLLQEIELNSRP